MSDTPAILFVCLGNICRSPLAEAAFRVATDEARLMAEIDSAGTGTWHLGEPPDKRAESIARHNGVDISGYRARQITPRDFDRFTHVVALDQSTLRLLEELRPKGATAELSLLLDHVPGREGQDVTDPYHGEAEGFEKTWEDAVAGARGLIARLKPKG
jgi:protein-tyrosine phosphatase